jgi:hypothetical protein
MEKSEFVSGFSFVRGSKRDVQDSFSGGSGQVLRFLRGSKMRTVQQAMDEFAAALQFPWYYGDNLDAFWDCVCDLSWLSPFSHISLVVFDAPLLLIDAASAEAERFTSLLADAGAAWLDSAKRGDRENSEPVIFSIILQVPLQGLEESAFDHLNVRIAEQSSS